MWTIREFDDTIFTGTEAAVRSEIERLKSLSAEDLGFDYREPRPQKLDDVDEPGEVDVEYLVFDDNDRLADQVQFTAAFTPRPAFSSNGPSDF
ncbi:hypothetical protein [Mangrovicoccus sp. HB161399]|uniref:hypothetical protein n=1 Tax=Mangrovicoccus sp. HB161399 TaxID=2720392 RepID=UPI001551BD2C|nr:hypothetical protein [Mangrovicoccus sp. HB161399]